MGTANNIVALLALLSVIGTVCCQISQGGPHQSQGGPHDSQGVSHHGRSRRQAPQDIPETPENLLLAACDNVNTTSISCYDCTTRLICKPNSIVLIKCKGNVKPFCNYGICSSVLSPDCE